MNVVKVLGGMATARAGSRCLSILIFHRVLPRPDPLFPEEADTERFDSILRWIRASFRVLPLDAAITAMEQGELPPRALAITFDDGYADNFTHALPLLQRHGLPATFFVATSFLDGGRMWNDSIIEAVRSSPRSRIDLSDDGLGVHPLATIADRRLAIDQLLPKVKYLSLAQREPIIARIAKACGGHLPDDLMMSTSQLRGLHAAGMGVGGHTLHHPILAQTSDEQARAEIVDNKACLEALLGVPMTLFAYPNGKPGQDYSARHADMVRAAGYRAAVSTAPGAARRGADLMQLPRFTPWDRAPLKFGLRLVHNMQRTGQVAA